MKNEKGIQEFAGRKCNFSMNKPHIKKAKLQQNNLQRINLYQPKI